MTSIVVDDGDRSRVGGRIHIAFASLVRIGGKHGHPKLLRLVHKIERPELVRGIKCRHHRKIGRASCRERVCQYVEISVVSVALKNKTKQHKPTTRQTDTAPHSKTRQERIA